MDEAERQRRQERVERVERRFAVPTTIAALLAIPAVLAPVLSHDPTIERIGLGLDWLVWGVFALEVAVLVPLAPDRGAWLRHHRLTLFILVAAWPGWLWVAGGTPLEELAPALLLVQKLLKLLKVDRFYRRSGTYRMVGRWLLLVPAVAAVIVVAVKVGPVSGLILLAALLLGVIGPEGRPHPRLRRLARRVARRPVA